MGSAYEPPYLPPAGCQSAKSFLLWALFHLSHGPHWLTVELGFSVTDRLFLKAPSFIKEEGGDHGQEVGFPAVFSMHGMSCLRPEHWNGPRPLRASFFVFFPLLFLFVMYPCVFRWWGVYMPMHVEARAQYWGFQSQTYFLRENLVLTVLARLIGRPASKNLVVSVHSVLGDYGWYEAGDPNSRPCICTPFTSSTESSIQPPLI